MNLCSLKLNVMQSLHDRGYLTVKQKEKLKQFTYIKRTFSDDFLLYYKTEIQFTI